MIPRPPAFSAPGSALRRCRSVSDLEDHPGNRPEDAGPRRDGSRRGDDPRRCGGASRPDRLPGRERPDCALCSSDPGQAARRSRTRGATLPLAILAIDEKPTPRVIAALLEMIASKDLPQDWRADAVERIRESSPKNLAQADTGLDPAARRSEYRRASDGRRAAHGDHRGHCRRDAGTDEWKVRHCATVLTGSPPRAKLLGFEICGAGLYDSGSSGSS